MRRRANPALSLHFPRTPEVREIRGLSARSVPQARGMDPLLGLHGDIGAQDPRRLGAALRRWREGHGALRPFRDPADLVGFLRGRDPGQAAERDAAWAALCLEATGGDREAALLLLRLLRPALRRARRRLGRWEAIEADDLEAELLAGVWEAAAEVRPDTRDVAGRLVNRGLWRALGAMREAIEWSRRALPLPPSVADRAPGEAPGAAEWILGAALAEGVISPQEAELLLATRRSIRSVSERLGITLAAAQKRRRRARGRLASWLAYSSQFPRTPGPADSPHENPPGPHERPVHLRGPGPSL